MIDPRQLEINKTHLETGKIRKNFFEFSTIKEAIEFLESNIKPKTKLSGRVNFVWKGTDKFVLSKKAEGKRDVVISTLRGIEQDFKEMVDFAQNHYGKET